ncbi:MAG: hypothetical protein ABMA26_18750 [Limisphaerales bacterium]
MSRHLTLITCALALTFAPACRKRAKDATEPATPTQDKAAAAAPAAPPKDAPPAEALHFLNDAVRNFYAEKLKMPASLDEVYAAGYLKERFNPPAGRQYVINQQSRAVELR